MNRRNLRRSPPLQFATQQIPQQETAIPEVTSDVPKKSEDSEKQVFDPKDIGHKDIENLKIIRLLMKTVVFFEDEILYLKLIKSHQGNECEDCTNNEDANAVKVLIENLDEEIRINKFAKILTESKTQEFRLKLSNNVRFWYDENFYKDDFFRIISSFIQNSVKSD